MTWGYSLKLGNKYSLKIYKTKTEARKAGAASLKRIKKEYPGFRMKPKVIRVSHHRRDI